MDHGRDWKEAMVSAVLAFGLMALPQNGFARDHCRNRSEYQRDRQGRYEDDAYSARRAQSAYSDYRPYSRSDAPYRSDPYHDGNDSYYGYSEPRSAGKSAAIIGGGAAAGAAIGGMTAGKKGAIIGGVAGAAGGLIYDRATRDDPNRRW